MRFLRARWAIRAVLLGLLSLLIYFADITALEALTLTDTEQAHLNELEKLRPEQAKNIRDRLDEIDRNPNLNDKQKHRKRRKFLEDQIDAAKVGLAAASDKTFGSPEKQAEAQEVLDILESFKRVHLDLPGKDKIPQRVADEKKRIEEERKKKAESGEPPPSGSNIGYPGDGFIARGLAGMAIDDQDHDIDTNFGADAGGDETVFAGVASLNADFALAPVGMDGATLVVAGGFFRVYFGPDGEIETSFHPTTGDDTTLSFDPHFSADPYIGLRFIEAGSSEHPIFVTAYAGPSFLWGEQQLTTDESCCGGRAEDFDDHGVNVGVHGGVIVDFFAPDYTHAISGGLNVSYHEYDIGGHSSSFPFAYDGTSNTLMFVAEVGIAVPP